MVCGRVSNLISAYLDRELTGAEMLSVQRHLARCPTCSAERDAMQQMRQLLGSLGAVEPPSGSEQRLFTRLSGGAYARPRRARAFPWPPRFFAHGAAWAGALCFALLLGLTFNGLRQPQHPDSVVAMVRPSMDADTPILLMDPGPDPWRDDRYAIQRAAWPVRARPAFQLVGNWPDR